MSLPAGDSRLSVGRCASLACVWEATAPKPGNVYRGADFTDLSYLDFVASALAIEPVIENAARQAVGQTVLAAIRATRQIVSTNTNLGIVLLLAPLAAVPREQPLAVGLPRVLESLTAEDCRDVYEAITLAQPGAMGRVAEADLASPPPQSLLAAMRLAEHRDRVARQYVSGFADVLECAAPWIAEGIACRWPLADATVHAQLRMLAQWPDSLIARKCGLAEAEKISHLAGEVLQAADPREAAYQARLADFDFYLRSDGHRRNPGTTADLVAAGLFVLLREGIIDPKVPFYRAS